MTTITVHSFKSGVGKSLLAVMLSYEYSNAGEKVLLIDGDYSAPCLDSFFPYKAKVRAFTSFLQGKHNLKDCLSDTGQTNLSMCHAPNLSFREEILHADSRAHDKYLKRMLDGIDQAKNDFGFQKIIIDNSAGSSLAAINQLTCSDKSLLVMRPVSYDVESAYEQARAIYKTLREFEGKSDREDFLVWNQVPTLEYGSFEARIEQYMETWNEKFNDLRILYGAHIPYMSDIASGMISDETIDPAVFSEMLKPFTRIIKAKLGK
jgi:MinD-like ATPase involved in chromosome partitioning or flagellar assembly